MLLLAAAMVGQEAILPTETKGSWSFVTYFGNATLQENESKYGVRFLGGGIRRNFPLTSSLQLQLGLEGYRAQGNPPDSLQFYTTHQYVKAPVALGWSSSMTALGKLQVRAGLFAAHHIQTRREPPTESPTIKVSSPGTVVGLEAGFGVALAMTQRLEFLLGLHYQSDLTGWYQAGVPELRLQDVYAVSFGIQW